MSTLFRQGFRAETVCENVTAFHMNTSSVYTLKQNPNVTIRHSAPYGVNGDWNTSVDQFAVRFRDDSDNEFNSSCTISTLKTFSDWECAYAFASQFSS